MKEHGIERRGKKMNGIDILQKVSQEKTLIEMVLRFCG